MRARELTLLENKKIDTLGRKSELLPQIIQQYVSGIPPRIIGKNLSIDDNTVTKWLTELPNFEQLKSQHDKNRASKQGLKISSEEKQKLLPQIIQQYVSGISPSIIAKNLSIDDTTVAKWLKELPNFEQLKSQHDTTRASRSGLKISSEEKQKLLPQIIQQYVSGISFNAIAKNLSIGNATVERWLKELPNFEQLKSQHDQAVAEIKANAAERDQRRLVTKKIVRPGEIGVNKTVGPGNKNYTGSGAVGGRLPKSYSGWDPGIGDLSENAPDIIVERATDVLYHATGITSARNILRDGVFKLTPSTGSQVERKYEVPGRPYFLSTTRSRVGDYHRYAGSARVMFVLNGDWFNLKGYITKPVDYWYSGKTPDELKRGEWRQIDPENKKPMWSYSPERTSESEDRIYSETNTIPIDAVTTVHVYIREPDERLGAVIRQILIDAKKRGIKTYLYNDDNAWRLQDTRKSLSPSQAKDLIKGVEHKGYSSRPVKGVGASAWGRSDLLDWIELIKKQPGQPLSKSADKLRYSIKYYGDPYKGLENSLSNARKPDNQEYQLGITIIEFMRKNNLTPKALADYLKNKWKDL